MSDCDCTFSYHSVIPPTHCPKCGRCLGCGQGFYPPIYPVPYTPWPVYPTPIYPHGPSVLPWRGGITYSISTSATTNYAA